MYTEPKIVTKPNLSYRSHISFHFNGKRFREYNGNRLKIKIYPNYASSIKEKDRLLRQLLFEFKKSLETGWNPLIVDEPIIEINAEPIPSLEQLFLEVEATKLSSPLSDKYKRNIKSIVKQFLAFLSTEEKCSPLQSLKLSRIETFLNQFKSSATNYMNIRRMLGLFFAEFERKKYITVNLILNTPRLKPKAALHKIYTKEQLIPLLDYLKKSNPDLYLCCLLSYSCMLRPHIEIRLLKKRHFNDDFSTISLSGAENKSARVRVVSVPKYLQTIIENRLSKVQDPETNIFTLSNHAFNEYYFNLIWTRLKSDMSKNGLIQSEQTIYSFRHTAAIDVYNRTKDIHILQQLLGHSTMIVTLKYLRGLGELNSQQLKDVLPVLELV
ncbi:site-specific integrase [Mucilaginibacter sp. cycad4]|uniref:tyrosine-type recombinase/integrase n=1 Tax=Mucilaginibacter sp. cycad4 TaxID=3342096 RepID=UPI002AAB3DD6|nr:site-specific integrase [Mucilaginibacter gossypii]WPV00589.1 site-specific integrase [Mucilaginibacter gossypii]